MKNKPVSTSLSTIEDKSLSEWDGLIVAARQRIRELKQSIRTWQEFRDAGEPWPGTVEANVGEPKTKTRRLQQE